MKTIIILALIASSLASYANNRHTFALGSEELIEVGKIAKAISVVQPYLDEAKYLQYATGIYRAALRFRIDPHLLIAIANHETSFRENLPEGAAGELGICQIRKMWVKNPKLRAAFGNLKESDLLRPSKSFMIAAWILHDLKPREEGGTLPYWAYYNSVRFENRLKYFLPVNKYLVTVRKAVGHWSWGAPESEPVVIQPAVGLPRNSLWTPTSKPRPVRRQTASMKESGWIAAALENLENQERAKTGRRTKGYSSSTLRAASEFDVKHQLINQASVTD